MHRDAGLSKLSNFAPRAVTGGSVTVLASPASAGVPVWRRWRCGGVDRTPERPGDPARV
jgi:hypothetical protein